MSNITLSSILGPTRVFNLLFPIQLEIMPGYEFIVLKHVESGLHGYGEDLERAATDFCELFEIQYENLVECPIEQIHESALSLRACLANLVAI